MEALGLAPALDLVKFPVDVLERDQEPFSARTLLPNEVMYRHEQALLAAYRR